MTRAESVIVGFVVGITCPLLLFVFCWWATAALSIYHIVSFPVSIIIVAAFTGMGLGFVLDILYLKNWVRSFYRASMKVMALVYLLLSVIAVAFFMGLPIGNIFLGAVAGLYVGRKQYHTGGNQQTLAKGAKRVGVFTACVTSLEALPIAILALDERELMDMLETLLRSAMTGFTAVALVASVCIGLFVVQYSCTRVAASLAFGLSGRAA